MESFVLRSITKSFINIRKVWVGEFFWRPFFDSPRETHPINMACLLRVRWMILSSPRPNHFYHFRRRLSSFLPELSWFSFHFIGLFHWHWQEFFQRLLKRYLWHQKHLIFSGFPSSTESIELSLVMLLSTIFALKLWFDIQNTIYLVF